MKQIKTIPPRNAPPGDPPQKYNDTDLMLELTEGYIAKIRKADIPPGQNAPKILKGLARRAKIMARQFLEMEMENLCAFLKDQMLRHKSWRRAVLRALGGERALNMWEMRKDRARARREDPSLWPEPMPELSCWPASRHEAPHSASPHNAFKANPRPPEIAIFKLEKICIGRNPHLRYAPVQDRAVPAARREIAEPRIELTPDELRYGRADIMDIEDAEYLNAVAGGTKDSLAPFTHVDIHGWLAGMVQEYRTLMFTIRKTLEGALGHEIPP